MGRPKKKCKCKCKIKTGAKVVKKETANTNSPKPFRQVSNDNGATFKVKIRKKT